MTYLEELREVIRRLHGTADDPDRAKHHVTILHSHPIESAPQAVRAAIVQEFRSLESAS